MEYFKKSNNWTGWAVFAVALVVYVLTAEPVASWWDCMEFTATSYKLEVGHPPGAPLFMMIMRLFTMLSFGDTAAVGFASNLMSCVASAFCILFMFWTITRLARKVYGRDGREFDGSNKAHVWTVMGAGIIGSLAYAFTDSFWFSAVESEVYALSSMFTALVVWMMLRWEEVADEPGSTRWLILIAYMMGLSIGVHILNLLTIPALVFIYYFRKTERVSVKGILLALLASGGILLAIHAIIMPVTVAVGAWFDRVFVNGLGLPVNSGIVVWVLLLFALVALGVWITHKKGKVLWNTVLLCVGVILIGYGSYASVVIRAAAYPPMNSNNPNNPYGLLSLLNRDQYESQPIVYGPVYSSRPMEEVYSTTYTLDADGKYQKNEVLSDYKYPSEFKMLFPRMWNYRLGKSYEAWTQVDGHTARYGGETVKMPTMGENLNYFVTFQLNFMYWRYFMWNFVGRQNDLQGDGGITKGNWLSGIGFIDALYLGPQDNLPDEIARNKARNTFFFLPLLLGILGLIYQLSKSKRGFSIVMWLFFMMGPALVVYFNITPDPPRERDYIYAGSFYAFAIWIGFGVMWVQEVIAKLFKERGNWASAAIATVICAVVPTLLVAEGWDDHDRSHRRIGHDIGYNFLVSCPENAIIMNYGDNDTFPLWYNQEVENVRPDVRIMNMSYIGGDWYIEQMLHAYNSSAPVPLSIPMPVYGENSTTFVQEVIDRPLELQWVVDFITSRDARTRLSADDGTQYDYLPTKKLALPVNKENALAAGIVKPEDAHRMVDTVFFELPKEITDSGRIDKTQLVLLDLLASFDWSRPLCFTTTKNMRDIGLGDWLQADGWTYRFVPIKTKFDIFEAGRIDTSLTYDLLMNRYKYGNASDPRVYVDYTSLINLRFVQNYNTFSNLADRLLEQGEKEKAVEVLDRAMAEYPTSQIDFDFWSIYPIVEDYYKAGAMEKGDALWRDYTSVLQDYIEYYLRFEGRKSAAVEYLVYDKYRNLEALAQLAEYYDRNEMLKPVAAYLGLFEAER